MSWPTPPLGSLVETIVPARDKPVDLGGETPWVRIEDFEGKYLSGSKSGQGVTDETIRSMPLRVFPAGTVVCTCSCTMGTTAIVTRPLVTNQTFIGLVPRSAELSSEFLYYALQGHRERLTATATGAIQTYLSREDFRSLRIPIPPVFSQRAIAGYLDRETAQIDAIIAAKQRMMDLLEARTWIAFCERVSQSRPLQVPLRRALCSVIDGPFGSAFSSSDYSADGAVVIRLGNIGFACYRDADEARIPMNMFEKFRQYRVLQGDLLIAGLGDDRNHAGRACVAPDLGPAMVKGKCFRGRVDPGRANADFLALLLSSPLGAAAMNISGRGSTRSMINLEIVKTTEIPLPDRHTQDSIVADTRGDQLHWAEMTGKLARQLGLLHERRQAVITAAVTGQLDILGAA